MSYKSGEAGCQSVDDAGGAGMSITPVIRAAFSKSGLGQSWLDEPTVKSQLYAAATQAGYQVCELVPRQGLYRSYGFARLRSGTDEIFLLVSDYGQVVAVLPGDTELDNAGHRAALRVFSGVKTWLSPDALVRNVRHFWSTAYFALPLELESELSQQDLDHIAQCDDWLSGNLPRWSPRSAGDVIFNFWD